MLAGGGSSRMGRPKQLVMLEGKTLVARTAEAALAAGAYPVIVVLGANVDEIRPALSHLPELTVVVNPDWSTGLASSLTTGLRAASDTACDGVLVMLADQPNVDAGVVRRLLTRFRGGARIVAAGYHGTPGVPALFGREHIASLLGLTGEAGAGPWLQSRGPDVTIVELDSELLDVDTASDLERLARRTDSR